jgi:hypothetical protein
MANVYVGPLVFEVAEPLPKPRRAPTCFTCHESEHPGRKLLRASPISPLTCGDCMARGVPLAKQPVKEPERIKYHAWETPSWDGVGDT